MKILYRGPLYRCIHSPEEEAACLADGWQIAPEDGVQYIPHTAVEPTPTAIAEPVTEPAAPPITEPADLAEKAALVMGNVAERPLIILPAKRPPVKLRPPVAIVGGNLAPRE